MSPFPSLSAILAVPVTLLKLRLPNEYESMLRQSAPARLKRFSLACTKSGPAGPKSLNILALSVSEPIGPVTAS